MVSRKKYLAAIAIVEQYNKQLDNSYSVMPCSSEFKPRRIKLNLSMDEVSKNTGVGKSTISRLENGYSVEYPTVKSINDFYVIKGG